MPNILQPDSGSRDNLSAFLQTIEDEGLRNLLTDHLQDILTIGRIGSGKETQAHRESFFKAVETLIEARAKEEP